MTNRLASRFARLKEQQRTAFIPFIMAGDPSPAVTANLLRALPGAGADIIELGVPFSDPMADGPVIESAGLRALAGGTTLARILDLVRDFRGGDADTPIILMGYYNPFYHYGFARFAADAAAAGVDGLILVDIPLEESGEVIPALKEHGLELIRLIAPTTPEERRGHIVETAGGFVYYIAVKGITGGKSGDRATLETAVTELKRQTDLPIAIGFGIRTPDQAREAARIGDAVVVGSAIVQAAFEQGPEAAFALARDLADAIHNPTA